MNGNHLKRLFSAAFLLLLGALIMESGCAGGGGGGGGGGGAVSLIAMGGNGVTNPGGIGGTAVVNASATGGDVEVKSGGGVSAGFGYPPATTPYLGYNPWVVTHDSTLLVYGNTGDSDLNAADGEYLLLYGHLHIFEKVAYEDYLQVTGLQVNPGATLTVGLNFNGGGNSGEDSAELELLFDAVVLGRIRPAALDTGNLNGTIEDRAGNPATSRDAGRLLIIAESIFVSGRVDASGADGAAAGQRGGYGGSILLEGRNSVQISGGSIDASGGNGKGAADGGDAAWGPSAPGNIQIQSDLGTLVNRAVVRADGGFGANGGNAANVFFLSNTDIYNGGPIASSGGSGDNGVGGASNTVELHALNGSVMNSARLEAEGGEAADDAGAGGIIEFYSYEDVLNSGKLDASGGDALVDGNGGAGGTVLLQSSLGSPAAELRDHAAILAMGGKAEGTKTGGNGGTAILDGNGPIYHQGGINVSGGNGDTGGPGGIIQFTGGLTSVQGLTGGIFLDGGKGSSGGAGGTFYSASDADDFISRSVSASAGKSTNGPGADGGYFGLGAVNGTASFSGTALLSAGDAAGAGDYAGGICLIKPIDGFDSFEMGGKDVEISGRVLVNGGDAVGNAAGGYGGGITITADPDLLKSTASYQARGGDGDAAVGTGGDGGALALTSGSPVGTPPTQWKTLYDVTAGNGATPGTDGTVTVDGVAVFP